MNRKLFTSLTLLTSIFASCSKEPIDGFSSNPEAVKFGASSIMTRTAGDSWESGDMVGIFSYNHQSIISPIYANVLYTTGSNSGSSVGFSLADNQTPIYFPESGSVDFYAYYPYQEEMEDAIYEANVSTQSDLGAIDLLVAKLENKSQTTESQNFTFYHKLSKLQLMISSKTDVKTLSGLEVKLIGANSEASFDLVDGDMVGEAAIPKEIVLNSVEDSEDSNGNVKGAISQAILLPETISEDATLLFSFDGHNFSAPFSGKTFESGKTHTFNISIGYNGVTFTGNSITGWVDSENNNDDIIDAEEIK